MADSSTPPQESTKDSGTSQSAPMPVAYLDVRVKEMPKAGTPWVAIAAFVVSILSLIVTISGIFFQSRIAALGATPAVALYSRWEMPIQENKAESNILTLMWKIENTGPGIAVISRSEVYFPRTEQHLDMDDNAAWKALQEELSRHYEGKFALASFNYEPVPRGYAVQSGGEWSLFEVSVRDAAPDTVQAALDVAVVAICYCSLYGDCFYRDSRSALPEHPLFDCPERQSVDQLITVHGAR